MAWLKNKKPIWFQPGENGKGGPLTLPLLERPRPTWSMPDKKSKIPGRKFFVHHPWSPDGILERQYDPEKSDKDQPGAITPNENNRTVEPLAKGNRFEFEIGFHNLRKWELGLLLYSLELEDNLAHKLGMAKSHGFGSVRITVEEIELKNKKSLPTKEDLIKAGFKHLGVPDIQSDDLERFSHIRQLREALWLPPRDSSIQVRYPGLEKEGDIPGYVNFTKKTSPGSDEDAKTYMDIETRLNILQNPWRSWHTTAK